MSKIKLEHVKEGDVLCRPVVVEEVELFERGTVLTSKIIKILGMLSMQFVDIDTRSEQSFSSMKEAFYNIDQRFSFVEDNDFMMSIKHMVKDVLSNVGLKR